MTVKCAGNPQALIDPAHQRRGLGRLLLRQGMI